MFPFGHPNTKSTYRLINYQYLPVLTEKQRKLPDLFFLTFHSAENIEMVRYSVIIASETFV